MRKNPQLPAVSCTYGAPMGRREYGDPSHAEGFIRVFRVRLDSGGYDEGGAYWGTGTPLWCAEEPRGEYRAFIRAASRLQAVAGFGIPARSMAKPPKAEYLRLRALSARGVISAQGVQLLQTLEALGFDYYHQA